MKLHIAQTAANLVTSYGEGYVTVLQNRYEKSLIVLPDEVIADWPPENFEALKPEHLAVLVARNPEIVLLGTGNKLRFPRPEVMRPLIETGRGYEVMDLPAACRTYNILVAEGRRVAAALIMD
ncbi:MAG TPA: Mth938-like domain-containing protein [Burkholderiales bacterium]|nr:Mth938-like domain-containing protein [Burkholderiales bacterium]